MEIINHTLSVDFSQGRAKKVVDGLDLEIAHGEKIGLVGSETVVPSRAGYPPSPPWIAWW